MTILQSFAALPPTKRLVYINSSQITTSNSIFTFASSSLGTASWDRRIIVAVATANSTRAISSVTVAGITATINVTYEGGGDNNTTAIVTAWVPTGTTGDIVVTLTGGTNPNCIVGWWAAYGLTSNDAINTTTDAVATATPTLTLTTKPGGFAIYVYGTSASGATSTWGTATERFDLTNSRSGSGAEIITTGTSTSITPTLNTSNTNRNAIGASF